MSNSMQNDYFSFMSDRWDQSASKRSARPAAPAVNPVRSSDTIDFVEETSEIEVIESALSDTMMQRMRLRWGNTG